MIASRLSLLLAAATLLLPACSKPSVETYRVAKETPPAGEAKSAATATPAAPTPAPAKAPAPAASANPMANTAVATASGADLVWTAPAHWTAKTGSSMRKGSYVLKADGVAGEADLSITAFPGSVGGDLANLNRWRGQIELPPIAQADFESTAQRMERNGLRFTVVDILGTAQGVPTRILGAMIPHAGATWFVKVTGPDAIVVKEKAAFAAFLDTIKAPAAAK